ncbi:hypothetical protein [Blautia sp. An81]|uniref:hypothetical protein n=1 Tax=Blautia sp. An81 TaxID=1965659 RepID=UPI0019516BC8|nr:hypothetical protein [Blautia sp. An81]
MLEIEYAEMWAGCMASCLFAWEKETVTGSFSKNKIYCFFESDILHILYADDIISTTV